MLLILKRDSDLVITVPLLHVRKLEHFMNKNINYLGMVNLLRKLQAAGLVSQKEAQKIAARFKAETGVDVIFSL